MREVAPPWWKSLADRRTDVTWPAVLAVALLDIPLRLDHLLAVPKIGDEWGEILLGYRILKGEALPLHNQAHDIGPLFNYLLALLFHLFGVSLSLPRMTVMVLSIGTVLLTYLLGRALFGRWVGLLAAALLATDNVDILVTHMAWSNDIAPFLVVASSLLLLEASRRGRAWYVAAGFAWALALQSHSSVLALLPSVLFLTWYAAPAPRLRQGWVWAGHAAFVVGYLNMIVWNVIHPLDSLRWIYTRKHYAVSTGTTVHGYLQHTGLFWEEIARSLSTASMTPALFLHSAPPPLMAAVFALFLLGLVLAVRRGSLLVPLLVLGPALVYPYLNRSYAFIVDSRYIDPLVPLGMIAVALGFVEVTRALLRRLKTTRARTALRVASALAALALVLSPVPSLGAYYAYQFRHGNTNRPLFALAGELKEAARGRTVLLDSRSAFARFLPDVLTVEGLKVDEIGDPWADHGKGVFSLPLWRLALRRHPKGVLVLTPEDERRLRALLDQARARSVWSSRDYVVSRPRAALARPSAG